MRTAWSKDRRRRIFSFLILFVLGGVCFSCSMPRIVTVRDPLTPEEHLNLGVAYERNGELDLAIREYELALKRLPVAYLYLGNAYLLKNEFKIASDYYRKAIEKDPNNADAHNNLAWLYYLRRENLDEAENLALRALELNPQKESLYRDTLHKIQELKRPPD